jgi:penicillin-binding protein 1A
MCRRLGDVAPWRLAVVLEQRRGLGAHRPAARREKSGEVRARARDRPADRRGYPLDARPGSAAPRSRGRRRLCRADRSSRPGQFRLRQMPEISGAIVAMDPYTGRVLAMVGGFSFDQSEFNRATQAMRQPGSSFKPFVYATALDNGYTPSSVVMDAPIEIDPQGNGEVWRPENYGGDQSTARTRCATASSSRRT